MVIVMTAIVAVDSQLHDISVTPIMVSCWMVSYWSMGGMIERYVTPNGDYQNTEHLSTRG